jgi:cytochrome c6
MIAKLLTAVVLLGATALPGIVRAADIGAGQMIYNMHCVPCHGVRGESVIPGAPSFARGDRLMQPDMGLMMTIKAGKNGMPSFNGILRDQQILDVVAYLRTLRR